MLHTKPSKNKGVGARLSMVYSVLMVLDPAACSNNAYNAHQDPKAI